ncbi:MAG TPA: hypothetical protein VFI03_08575, partial [Solirubrobacterales bacterium]|nr:hypothetical protein [Solirubrobacterales bacterium]
AQTGLLYDGAPWDSPRAEADLPLLDSENVPENHRLLWLACERLYVTVFGARRAYVDYLSSLEVGLNLELISAQFRGLGAVVFDSDPGFESFQNRVESLSSDWNAPPFLEHHGFAFGATQLMEGAARLNEMLRLEDGVKAKHDRYRLDRDAYLVPPYSDAWEIYLECTARETIDIKDSLAFCVLCDWALNAVLPPVFPLSLPFGEEVPLMPGAMFLHLVRALDVEIIPEPDENRIGWARAGTEAIYKQLSGHFDQALPTPLKIAEIQLNVMKAADGFAVPESIYKVRGPESWEPTNPASRLRYLTILAARAARTRIAHPAFFPIPYAHYSTDRADFHELWDPIQPPFVSVGPNRLVPHVFDDANWFGFFYTAAVANDVAFAAAVYDCAAVAATLQKYRGTFLREEVEDSLIARSVEGVLGDGSATAAILEIADICPD